MDQFTLTKMFKNITAYFGKPEVKTSAISEWMKDLSRIPNETVDWIESKIKANKYPDNPPQAIRKLWFQWLEEHPMKRDRERSDCVECEGTGWRSARKGNGNWKSFQCGVCNHEEILVHVDCVEIQGMQRVLSKTKEQLKRVGYITKEEWLLNRETK